MPFDDDGGDGAGRRPDRAPSRNVLGGTLEDCSQRPLTGFFRNGCCDTGPADMGSHTVCAVMTAEFLAFSRQAGNDLSTPRPEFGFAGLQAGRPLVPVRAALGGGAGRGRRARVVLRATHAGALRYCALADLKAHAVDLA